MTWEPKNKLDDEDVEVSDDDDKDRDDDKQGEEEAFFLNFDGVVKVSAVVARFGCGGGVKILQVRNNHPSAPSCMPNEGRKSFGNIKIPRLA